jgi:hypothetical protein
MYNEIDEYIIECIRLGKKYSGKKIDFLKTKTGLNHLPISLLYSKATEKVIPLCAQCNENYVELQSISKGFRNFCSTKCYRKSMSKRNSENNAKFNKLKSKKNKERLQELLLLGKSEYVENDTYTIKEVANKINISHNALRTYLNENGLVDKNRQTKKLRQKHENRLEKAHKFLNDKDWVYEKIKGDKWVSKTFAKHLDCSKNFVCDKLRDNGIFLSDYNRFTSSYENQISELLEKFGVEYIRNDRKVLRGKELDIYVPSKKLAIEINGIFWHQDIDGSKRNYHLDKTEACEKESIRLLHITDKEIDDNMKLITNVLKSSLGLNETIYARKCELKQISSSVFLNFNLENHLQGNINSSIRYGLFYQGNLVSVMGFAKPRFNKNYQYEITRFCNKSGINVVGGASKLFKHFIKEHSPNSVISYCDRRFFTGITYEKIGMNFIRVTPASYVWVHNNTGEVLSRYRTQKHMLKENDPNISETEYMISKGYMKIYDSGQKVYGYRIG